MLLIMALGSLTPERRLGTNAFELVPVGDYVVSVSRKAFDGLLDGLCRRDWLRIDVLRPIGYIYFLLRSRLSEKILLLSLAS